MVIQCSFNIDGEVVEEVNQFSYVGSQIITVKRMQMLIKIYESHMPMKYKSWYGKHLEVAWARRNR